MAALPYIQLYAADYLADTTHLTLEEHGAYLLMILNYWQRGEPPMDEPRRLAAICRCSQERWAELRPSLLEFFTIHEGRWHHGRIDADLLQVARQQNQRIAAGRASANARKMKEIPTVVQRASQRLSNGRSTNTDTDTDTDTEKRLKKTSKEKRALPFRPPTEVEVAAYCLARKNTVNPLDFVAHYEASGWFRGKTKIKNWKACVRTWETKRGQSDGDKRQEDKRSKAQRHSDTLDAIARKADEREVGGSDF